MKDEEIVAMVEAAETKLLERIEKTETTLLKEFRKWAIRIEGALKIHAVQISVLNDRVGNLEERLDDMQGGTH